MCICVCYVLKYVYAERLKTLTIYTLYFAGRNKAPRDSNFNHDGLNDGLPMLYTAL